MRPTLVLSAPGEPHVSPMNLLFWVKLGLDGWVADCGMQLFLHALVWNKIGLKRRSCNNKTYRWFTKWLMFINKVSQNFTWQDKPIKINVQFYSKLYDILGSLVQISPYLWAGNNVILYNVPPLAFPKVTMISHYTDGKSWTFIYFVNTIWQITNSIDHGSWDHPGLYTKSFCGNNVVKDM